MIITSELTSKCLVEQAVCFPDADGLDVQIGKKLVNEHRH